MAGYFIFNGIDTRTYGITVSAKKVYGAPKKEYTQIAVPGRNGDVFLDNGRYSNITVEYECLIEGKTDFAFSANFESFRAAIASAIGYCRLEDNYNAGKYRLAVRTDEISTESFGAVWHSGTFTVRFSCQPQMFYNEADFDFYIGTRSRIFKGLTDYKMKIKRDGNTNFDLEVLTSFTYKGTATTKETFTVTTTEHVIEFTPSDGSYVILQRNNGQALPSGVYLYVSFEPTDDHTPPLRDISFDFSGNTWIHNPSLFSSVPQIKLDYSDAMTTPTSHGLPKIELTVNGTRMVMNGGVGVIPESTNRDFTMDCERQTIKGWGKSNLAKYVQFDETNVLAQRYPTLRGGWNKITYVNNFDGDVPEIVLYDTPHITITPNFWTL